MATRSGAAVHWKKSSDVPPSSTPGICGLTGWPPVAIRMRSARRCAPFPHQHGVRVEQLPRHGDSDDPGRVEATPVAVVDVADVALAMDDEGRPVEFGGEAASKPSVRRELEPAADFGRQPHRLLRHAADIDAGAAEQVRLQQRHARTMLGGAECAGQSAGAAADDDQVEVALAVSSLSSRAAAWFM